MSLMAVVITLISSANSSVFCSYSRKVRKYRENHNIMFGHTVSILKNTDQRERESVSGIYLKNPASTLLFSLYLMQIALFLLNKIVYVHVLCIWWCVLV